jgi:hypothetical protein
MNIDETALTDGNASEQRQEWRLSSEDTVFVELADDLAEGEEKSRIVICDVLDMSANGLRVLMDEAPPKGSILRICVQLSDTETMIFLSAETMWIKDDIGFPVSDSLAKNDQAYQIGFSLFESEDTDIEAWKRLVADRII